MTDHERNNERAVRIRTTELAALAMLWPFEPLQRWSEEDCCGGLVADADGDWISHCDHVLIVEALERNLEVEASERTKWDGYVHPACLPPDKKPLKFCGVELAWVARYVSGDTYTSACKTMRVTDGGAWVNVWIRGRHILEVSRRYAPHTTIKQAEKEISQLFYDLKGVLKR